MKEKVVLGLLAVMAVGCAINPAAIEVAPQSSKALLVLQVERMQLESAILFVKYRKCDHQIDASTAGSQSAYLMESRARSGSYLVAEVPPGVYVMTSISQQMDWIVSLHARTVSFEVRPGEVVFVGKFDPVPHFRQLQELAKGDPVSRNNQLFVYGDNILPVRIETPRELDIAALQAHIVAAFPRVTAAIRVADVKPDYFLWYRDPTYNKQPCEGS